MVKHVLRIFRHDLRSWVPTVITVAFMTMLIGTCVNQFIWTSSEAFLEAASGAGLDPAEFQVVSTTVYMLIAVLSFFSLTVVGSATVERTRDTFAQWRLAGATPRQVRSALWSLVGVASLAGAVPGSLLSVFLSRIAVPVFNQMAAKSFPNGTDNFTPPVFHASSRAWLVALVLGVATCMVGAAVPARRASSVQPVEAVRGLSSRTRNGVWVRWVLGGLTVMVGVGMAVVVAAAPVGSQVGVDAAGMANSAITVGFVTAVGVHLLGPLLIPAVLAVVRGALQLFRIAPVGVVATHAARHSADKNANTIAPLAAATGLAGVLFTAFQSYQSLINAVGFELSNPNYTDTMVMTGLFGFVSLLTSVAVITLSGRDAVREQALLRTAGMTPRQVLALTAWQSLLMTVCMALFAMVPILSTCIVLAGRSTLIVGHIVVIVPLPGLFVAALACWAILFIVQWTQIGPWVRGQVAISLRRG